MRTRVRVVAVLGTDGSGKSTVLQAIIPVLERTCAGDIQLRHLRPGILPPLARLIGRGSYDGGPVTDPHGSTPSGALLSLVRLFYLLIDYSFGFWWLQFRLRKRKALLLFDRYAYDIAIDPRRFRIALSPGFLWRGVRLVPKPDLIICLHADPETIVARKRELPIEETRRQIEELLRFASVEPRAVLIDTGRPLQTVMSDFTRAVLPVTNPTAVHLQRP